MRKEKSLTYATQQVKAEDLMKVPVGSKKLRFIDRYSPCENPFLSFSSSSSVV